MKQKRPIDDLRPGDRVIIRETRSPRLVFEDGTYIEADSLQVVAQGDSIEVESVTVTPAGYLCKIGAHTTQPGELRLYGPTGIRYIRAIAPKVRVKR